MRHYGNYDKLDVHCPLSTDVRDSNEEFSVRAIRFMISQSLCVRKIVENFCNDFFFGEDRLVLIFGMEFIFCLLLRL